MGLKLFFEGSNEVTRFFGLSLVRDFMTATCRHAGAFAAADPQLTQIYMRCAARAHPAAPWLPCHTHPPRPIPPHPFPRRQCA